MLSGTQNYASIIGGSLRISGSLISSCLKLLHFINTLFQDIIHEKDGKHKELHKKIADIRREHDEVKRVVRCTLRLLVDLHL